jgi:hypothetical protein
VRPKATKAKEVSSRNPAKDQTNVIAAAAAAAAGQESKEK